MILNNTSLGFSTGQSDCDCRTDDFCQTVVIEDSPQWQIVAVCDELSGGTEKQPCENNQIGNYTSTFGRYDGDTLVPELNGEFVFNSTSIVMTDAQAGANVISTPVGYLLPNTCYRIRYTVSGYQSGFVQTVSGPSTTKGPNAREANGTYEEIYCTDAQGRLRFQIGLDDDQELLNTFILSNIFAGCIRYSRLYDIEYSEGDEGSVTYANQTTFEKTEATTNDVKINPNYADVLIQGKEYKICLTVSDAVSGSVTINIGLDFSETITTNGRFCFEFTYNDTGTPTFEFILSEDFVGKVGDIELNLVPEIKVGLFDCDGNEVEDALTTTQIGNTLKIGLSESVQAGCYTIGAADSCLNYRKQFGGNVFDVDSTQKYSPNINTTTGAWISGTPNDENVYTNSILFKDAVCCGKLYTSKFTVAFAGTGEDLPVLNNFAIAVEIGGTVYSASYSPDEPITDNPFEIEFTNIEAGCQNTDILVSLSYQFEPAGTGEGLVGNLYLNDSDKTYLNMNEGQFCPEVSSRCIKVQTSNNCKDCDTLLIRYRNQGNAFGFDYTSEGYTESDGFYNTIRIPAKVWKPSYPKDKKVQKNSTGYRKLYFSDVDKKRMLTTGLLPESIHDALSIALEHDTLIIDGEYYVCGSDDYAPEWQKSSALASVEVELYVQRPRMLNTICN